MEGRLRQANDGVEVAIGQEFLSDAGFIALFSDTTVWQNNGCPSTGLELTE